MKVTSAHFNPKIRPYLKHNDRTNLKSPNIHQDLLHLNEYSKPSSQVFKEIDQLYSQAMEKLKGTKGKRTPKERSYHEAIFEITAETTMQQCQELADKIAELTGFRVLQIAIHRDEGHTDENGNFKTHHHAHAVFFTLDRDTGKQLARFEASLNKKNLSKIQDFASEVFGLQRGERGSKKAYVTDYREYKKIEQAKTDAKREILKRRAELEIQETEIKRMLETKTRLLQKIEDEEVELKRQREENKRESERISNELYILQRFKEEMETRHYRAFDNLETAYSEKLSLWKNILTFGKHNREVQEEFFKAKQDLTNSIKIAETKANHQVNHLKAELEDSRKDQITLENSVRKLINQKKAFEEEILALKQKNQNLTQKLAFYEPLQNQAQTMSPQTRADLERSRGRGR